MRQSFIFYRSFYDSLRELPDDQKGVIFDALCDYALNQKLPEFTGVNKALFTLIKPQIDANMVKYENGLKGAESGKKGGRPKGKETPRKPQDNPTRTPNDNVNGNENANGNDLLADVKKPKKSGWGDCDDMEDLKRNPDNPRAFCGDVIKLRQKDMDKLVEVSGTNETYMHKQLCERDDWMAEQEPHVKKNWFMSTLKWAENMKEYA